MNKKGIAAIIAAVLGGIFGAVAVGTGAAASKKDENDKNAEKIMNDVDDKFIENNHDYDEESDQEDQ